MYSGREGRRGSREGREREAGKPSFASASVQVVG